MSRIQTLLSALVAVLIPLSAGAADSGLAKPATPEAWLEQMLDGKKNGAAFKDPAAFAEWLDAITEPRFMTALAAVAVDPGAYPKTLANVVDPAAARNWSEFTDPQLYLRWMLAGASPSFQQAILSRVSDPAKRQRWLDAVGRPGVYAPMLANFGRAPNAWLQAPVTAAAPMARLMQPVTPMAWFGAMAEGMGSQAWLKLPAEKATAAPRYRY